MSEYFSTVNASPKEIIMREPGGIIPRDLLGKEIPITREAHNLWQRR